MATDAIKTVEFISSQQHYLLSINTMIKVSRSHLMMLLESP